jgi:integrase
MAKPFKEGSGWSVRLRISGQDIYLSGYKSAKAASDAADKQRQAIENMGKPVGQGPLRTSLAEALQHYASERLPFLKGAYQEANRINRFLRAVGLDVIKLKKPDTSAVDSSTHVIHWVVEFVPCKTARAIPRGLSRHRQKQVQRTTGTDQLRGQLAHTMFSDVSSHQLQELVKAMGINGYKAASIHLQIAQLRSLFNYARKVWRWFVPGGNPAIGLKLPPVNNNRDRILSNSEWTRLLDVLPAAENRYVIPALALLLETAMRSSEALVTATWNDIDWGACMLKLGDAKAGKREVPLSPAAISVLRYLESRRERLDTEPRILPLSYEALKSAWGRACARAGIEDANLHDIRHTAATRFALDPRSNKWLLKAFTGHKSSSQLDRYVNIKPADVVRLMHGRPLREDAAPAGLSLLQLAQHFGYSQQASCLDNACLPQTNVIKVDFGRRAA